MFTCRVSPGNCVGILKLLDMRSTSNSTELQSCWSFPTEMKRELPRNVALYRHITGLKVQVLEGPGNYSKWLHDLKYVAVCKDAWVLISPSSFPETDREDIISKPKRPIKPDLSQFNYQINVVPSDGDATAEQQIFRMEYNNYRLEISEYELDAKAYMEQQERMRNSRTLPLSTVHPTICDSISNTVVPSEVMAAIQNLCKPNVHQLLPGTVQP